MRRTLALEEANSAAWRAAPPSTRRCSGAARHPVLLPAPPTTQRSCRRCWWRWRPRRCAPTAWPQHAARLYCATPPLLQALSDAPRAEMALCLLAAAAVSANLGCWRGWWRGGGLWNGSASARVKARVLSSERHRALLHARRWRRVHDAVLHASPFIALRRGQPALYQTRHAISLYSAEIEQAERCWRLAATLAAFAGASACSAAHLSLPAVGPMGWREWMGLQDPQTHCICSPKVR